MIPMKYLTRCALIPPLISLLTLISTQCSTGGKLERHRIDVATLRPAREYLKGGLVKRPTLELAMEASEQGWSDEMVDHLLVSSLVFLRGQQEGERNRPGRFVQVIGVLVTIISILSIVQFGV